MPYKTNGIIIMGLNYRESAGKIYLTVSNGKLVRQFKEANENTVSRVNKNGKTVHENFPTDVTGYISNIEVKDGEYGNQWIISLIDGTDSFSIQLDYSSRYSSSFLKALPNLTPGLPVKIRPWQMADKNNPTKLISGITLYQNDGNGFVKIPPAYTKEEPNGLPEMKSFKLKEKGKDVVKWDDSERMQFLENMALNEMLPKIKASSPQVVDKPVDAISEAFGEPTEEAPF